MDSKETRDPPVVEIALPFDGTWMVQNSPARRVPSHGTHMLGTTYAVDFVGVDDRDRTAPSTSWRTAFATEPPELFFSFGRAILSPLSGRVVAVHRGEADHGARRSPLTLLPYALGQASRLRQGLGAIGGNSVVISPPSSRVFVAVMHLQAESIRMSVGQSVTEGEEVAKCGNSGNSTQPHVHVQAMDQLDPWRARGIPMQIKHFQERLARGQEFVLREGTVPNEGATVKPAR